MLLIVEESARTDTGRQRRSNEDAYFARAPVFAVADGMGGARAGETAAAIAADAFENRPDAPDDGERVLREVAQSANREIWGLAREDPSRSGMGTTLTAVLVGDGEVSIAHVGDSRAYRFRGGKLTLLTRDHSLVEELKRQGTLTDHEAERHPQRSIITRALGPEPEVEVDTQTHSVRDGDTFLLCSDGLTTMISDEEIAETLRTSDSLDQATSSLIEQANDRGGKDNITVVVFRIGDTEALSDDKSHTLVGAQSPLAEVEEEARPAPAKRLAGQPPAKRRVRLTVAMAATVLLIALVVAGSWVGLRQVYFIGTDENGLVTVYRGLPYELPAGVDLYREFYVSAKPAGKVRPRTRRRLLDHQLRSRSDAVALVRNIRRHE